jgi:hypothetical protein
MEEHERNCTAVLEALRKASIYCNQVKSNLFATELCFLGHIISGTGIKPDPRKTERIASWPQPTTATNVQGFLGLTRYIATFLPALAEYTSVLTPLTTKECDRVFPTWTAEHQTAFDHIFFFFFFGVNNLYTAVSKYMCGGVSRYQLPEKRK